MLCPAQKSVFSEMYPNFDGIDAKRKNMINPPMPLAEVRAIYESFVIEEPDKPVLVKFGKPEKEVLLPFKDVVKELVFYATRLPIARLWLRRVPAGIHLKYGTIKEALGETTDDGVRLSAKGLKEKKLAVCALMHELAHYIDRHSVSLLPVFPYQTVCETSPISTSITTEYSEAEILQLFLIEEAEKVALSHQVQYETEKAPSLAYEEAFYKHYHHYAAQFAHWKPEPTAGVWTEEEIAAERHERAFHYAAMHTMTESMRDFLKPYTAYFEQLPAKMKACCQTENDSFIGFNNIPNIQPTMKELEMTSDITRKIKTNL